jgi:hypothetical protein
MIVIMLSAYPYLTPNKSGKAVADDYPDLDSVRRVFVVYNSVKSEYEVWKSSEEFFAALEKIPFELRTYHEVIFNGPQRLKFDLDAPPEYGESEFLAAMEAIIETVTTFVYTTFLVDVTREDVTICRSAVKPGSISPVGNNPGSPDNKLSAHLIINRAVPNSETADLFTKRVIAALPAQIAGIIDPGVNKRTQNFRIVGCHKGDGRVKRIVEGNCSTLIGVANADLPSLTSGIPVSLDIPLTEEEINAVINMIPAGERTAHVIRKYEGNSMIFDRLMATHCELCDREHTSDNTLVVSITKDTTCILRCRKSANSRVIGKLREDEPELQTWVDKQIAAALKTPPPAGESPFAKCKVQNVYDEPQMRPFELADTLIVKAGMKLGKTKALREHLDAHYPTGGLNKPVIRFISFRQTFSGNIKEKFGEFTLYSDVQGPLSQDRLIVQVESLWRIVPGAEPPDLLILDECESIFEQFNSGLLRNFRQCFAVFKYLIAHSKRVIAMDANADERTFRVFNRMRPGFVDGAVLHHNTNKNASGDTYILTGNKPMWLNLLHVVVENHRVAIPVSSLSEGKTIHQSISSAHPGKRVKIYSSETSQAEKKDHFADVNSHWADYDVLIYTPTVSAGVSFEVKHYDYVFGYFTDMSCQVETTLQMIGRIRDVASRRIIVCISASRSSLPTTVDRIKDGVFETRDSLFRQYDEMGLNPEIDRNGVTQYHCSDYFYLWLENQRMANLSKNNFPRRFITVASLPGPKIELLTPEVYESIAEKPFYWNNGQIINRAHVGIKKALNDEHARKIAEAPELDEEAVESIRERMSRQEDIPEGERIAYERFKIRRDYRFGGEITTAFVLKYKRPGLKKIFKNRSAVIPTHDKTFEERMALVQANEALTHRYIMSMDEAEQYQDLSRDYSFPKHLHVNKIVQLIGFKHAFDVAYNPRVTMESRWEASRAQFSESVKELLRHFDIPGPGRKFDAALSFVDRVLREMYGVSLTTPKNDVGIYYLKQPNYFGSKGQPDDTPAAN